MRPLAIVFARAPRLGCVKRRLAAGIGDRAAWRLYRAMLARTLRLLAADRRFETIVAVTPPAARGPWLQGLATVDQAEGDLAARMGGAFARFPRRDVAIVGSDIPAITAGDVAGAFAALGRAQAAFGPASDGGYWLVAMGPRRPHRPFARVRWSSADALADTLVNFRNRKVALVRTLSDLDTAADLPIR